MPHSLIKEYFYPNVHLLGDLETYNEDVRYIDHLIDGNNVRFSISWFPAENEKPQLLEIHMSIRNIKKRLYKKAWIYKKENDWDIQEY